MNTIHDTSKKTLSNYTRFGSTLKTGNRIFKPYFKPEIKESSVSKASKDVLNTKNPERHIDQILQPLKEKISSSPSPPAPKQEQQQQQQSATLTTGSKRKKQPVKKKNPVKTPVKKKKTSFSIFDGYHTT